VGVFKAMDQTFFKDFIHYVLHVQAVFSFISFALAGKFNCLGQFFQCFVKICKALFPPDILFHINSLNQPEMY
jgi:hypothetical protein